MQILGLRAPLCRGTQGAEPARLLSAGTGAGGGPGTMIPAAGSALGPGIDPSAGSKEPGGRCRPRRLSPVGGSAALAAREEITSGKDAAEGGEAPAQR